MPPMARHEIAKRDSSSSKTFTIIFVLIIVFVAFVCLFWGFILPKWRKRTPQRPSSTRFNGLGKWATKYGRPASLLPSSGSSNCINHPPRRFPAHPGVMARSDRVPPQPHGAVMVYDPRTETPFPNSPPTTKPVSIPGITPRPSTSIGTLRSADGSQRLFSPSSTKKSLLRNRADVIGEGTEMTEYSTSAEFSEVKDCKLAVPEPLVLKPRGSGRPPPLTKQLEKFPIPLSIAFGSSGSSNDMHPNKLFAKLRDASQKDSTSDATLTTKPDRAQGNTFSDITSETSSIFIQDNSYGGSGQLLHIIQKKSPNSTRGDFSTALTSHVHRSGTLTRPRTPVAEYRELYERAAAEARSQPFRSLSLKRELTPSTEPLTASPTPFSIVRSVSTPPTSVKLPDKHLLLLPTPLRLKKYDSNSTPTPNVPYERISYTPSSVALPESPDKLAPLRNNISSKRPYRRSIGFYHRGSKPRPAALNIKNSFRQMSPHRRIKRVSKTDKDSLLTPTMPTKLAAARMSVRQGSSRYSRDTKGISIARTPVTSEFPTPTRSDFQVTHYSQEMPKRRSLDLIRSKVDDWNLHTEGIHLDPNEHVPCSKQTGRHSDLGPRSPNLSQGSGVFKLESSSASDFKNISSSSNPAIPRICVASSSDDIFSDEHEAYDKRPPTRGKERLQAQQSAFSTWTTSDSNLSSLMGRVAPGNAEWI